MLHQKFFNDETIDAPVDIRIIAGINDIILHTRPAVAIPRPACFFRPINPNIIPTIAHGIEIKYAQQDKHNDIIPNTIDATPNPGDSGGCADIDIGIDFEIDPDLDIDFDSYRYT